MPEKDLMEEDLAVVKEFRDLAKGKLDGSFAINETAQLHDWLTKVKEHFEPLWNGLTGAQQTALSAAIVDFFRNDLKWGDPGGIYYRFLYQDWDDNGQIRFSDWVIEASYFGYQQWRQQNPGLPISFDNYLSIQHRALLEEVAPLKPFAALVAAFVVNAEDKERWMRSAAQSGLKYVPVEYILLHIEIQTHKWTMNIEFPIRTVKKEIKDPNTNATFYTAIPATPRFYVDDLLNAQINMVRSDKMYPSPTNCTAILIPGKLK